VIRSMTGYGSAMSSFVEGTVTVEVRSVNSRGLRVIVKGPSSSVSWESELKLIVEHYAERGRVDLHIRVEDTRKKSGQILDEDRARAIIDACAQLSDEFGVQGEVNMTSMLGVSGILRDDGVGFRFEPGLEMIHDAVNKALEMVVEMRECEGARLEVDLRERVDAIRNAVHAAEELAPERLAKERDRLQKAVKELTGKELEEDRLAREIVLTADRWDVSEELVRTRSHLEAFEEFLDRDGEAVGKRLGFLAIELQREINTLGSKANDARISHLVVEAKNEIDKLREQVENVE
jgi:uncharacterized protein (TIGR00255 family)